MSKWDDYNFCLKAVKNSGYALKYVKDQTPEICLEAVKEEGLALQYVSEKLQTPEICLAAVKQNGWVLEFVDRKKFPQVYQYWRLLYE